MIDREALLPKTTTAAARLARRHDERVAGRSYLRAPADVAIRHAVEVRHAAFFAPSFLSLLGQHDIALVVSDGAGRWPSAEYETPSFVYVRLHGAEELYVSGYRPEQLDRWRDACRGWLRNGRDVYAYFDNDAKVHAPFDAMALMARLGMRLGALDLPRLAGRRGARAARPDVIVPTRADPRWALGGRARRRRVSG